MNIISAKLQELVQKEHFFRFDFELVFVVRSCIYQKSLKIIAFIREIREKKLKKMREKL